jgi:integrase
VATKFNFTKRTLEAIKLPATGHVYVYDTTQANLACCVLSTGIKTFYWIGRNNNRPERLKIGRFPDVSIENARKEAAGKNGDRARGVNLKQARDKGGTVAAAFEKWLTHARLRKKSWQADESNFNFHFGPLRSRRFATLTADEVSKWHVAIGKKRGPVIANRCRALLSSLYGKKPNNPCVTVDRFPEKSRERFLLPDEMRPFMLALKAEPPLWRDYWLLCLFTGARRGNVAAMNWPELDMQAGIWHLTGEVTKNGLPLAIVLPPPAVAILQARESERGGSPYVFPAESGAGHVRDPRKSWARVVRAAGTPGLHPHDLRRSLGSWQALAGSSLAIIGKSLGHSDLKSTQIYARLLLEPVRTSVNGAVQAMVAAGEAEPAPRLAQAKLRKRR